MTLSSAFYSGLCACFASLFGKLSGLEFSLLEDVWLRYAIKISCFALMVLLNGMMWTLFVKALQNAKTSVEATAVSTAVNYAFTGILGFIVFGEVTGLLWWFGISLVVVGVIIISKSDSNLKNK